MRKKPLIDFSCPFALTSSYFFLHFFPFSFLLLILSHSILPLPSFISYIFAKLFLKLRVRDSFLYFYLVLFSRRKFSLVFFHVYFSCSSRLSCLWFYTLSHFLVNLIVGMKCRQDVYDNQEGNGAKSGFKGSNNNLI